MTNLQLSYKATGVDFLGDIPDHWEVLRLKYRASYRTSNVDKKTKEGELPVRLCNYTDVYYRDRIRAGEGSFMKATASPQEFARFRLNEGDVVITKDSEDWQDIAVPALIEETADDFVCGYHLGIIRPTPLANPGFVFRAMQSDAVNFQLQVAATGITRFGLPNPAVGEALIPFPPHDEQRAIAHYLDAETARIDTLISKKRRLIGLLAEYRTALITQTVTHGLPPASASRQDFEELPIRRVFEVVNGGTPTSSEKNWNGDVEWATPADLATAHGDILRSTARTLTLTGLHQGSNFVPANSLIVSTRAPIGYVCETTSRMAFNQGCRGLVPRCNVDLRFFRHQLSVMDEQLQALGQGSTFMELSTPTLASVLIAVPELDEQRVIADYLDTETAHIDALSSREEAVIKLLKEYRMSLITAAVTGQVSVEAQVHR